MSDVFDEKKAQARSLFRSAEDAFRNSISEAASARHSLDQAEGAVAQIEEILATAPEEAKAEIARMLDEANQSVELTKKNLERTLASMDSTKEKLEEFRLNFIRTFNEEP